MKRCLVFTDQENGNDSADLLQVVRLMYGDSAEAYGVAFNKSPASLDGYFDVFLSVEETCISSHDIVGMTGVLDGLHKEYGFDAILIPATYIGRMLAPRLAMRLGSGIVADVTGIGEKAGEIEMIRPAFSGKLYAAIVAKGGGPIMMSVRPGAFNYQGSPEKCTRWTTYVPEVVEKGNIRLVSTREKEMKKDIRDSRVLISGGGGVMKSFARLEHLAKAMNGTVSASRRIIDSGIASRSIQVGQSGKTVSPRLYMALGIYGSLQHMEGLKDVDHIISVNVDKDAPICSLSDIVVEGDALEFIDRLVEKIEEMNN